MALPSSGQISMSEVNVEAGDSASDQITMTQAFSKLSYYPNSDGVAPLSMSELYGANIIGGPNTASFNWSFPRAIPENGDTNFGAWVIRRDNKNDPQTSWATFSFDIFGFSDQGSGLTRQLISYADGTAPPNRNIFIYNNELTIDSGMFSPGNDLNISASVHDRNSDGSKGTLVTSQSTVAINTGADVTVPEDSIDITTNTNNFGSFGYWIQIDIEDLASGKLADYVFSDTLLFVRDNAASTIIEGVNRGEMDVNGIDIGSDGTTVTASYLLTSNDVANLSGSDMQISLTIRQTDSGGTVLFSGSDQRGTVGSISVSDTITQPEIGAADRIWIQVVISGV